MGVTQAARALQQSTEVWYKMAEPGRNGNCAVRSKMSRNLGQKVIFERKWQIRGEQGNFLGSSKWSKSLCTIHLEQGVILTLLSHLLRLQLWLR